jgi:4-diphosphocytidyl-2-C-methyl-D-erythritol kinase
MVSLDLADTLVVDPAGTGITAVGPFAEGVPRDHTNIVAAALSAVDQQAGVTIDKQIPHGGGLGGGSSDAAAILRWAGHPTDAAGLAAAATLGADVPFCLIGGRARVRGIGDIIEPLPFIPETFTLVIPPLSVSTPLAYRAWDDLDRHHASEHDERSGQRADEHDDRSGQRADAPRAPTEHDAAERRAAQRAAEHSAEEHHGLERQVGRLDLGPNALEDAALLVEPLLAWWRAAITERTGTPAQLAGSGATWFVAGQRDDALADLIDEGARIIVARTVPRAEQSRRPADQ